MSGDNMESLLLGGDDSSSGDSDDEVPMGTTAASSVAAIPAPNPPPQPAAPAPPPPPAPAASSNQSELSARLKSLYSSQPKRATPTSGGIGTPPTTNTMSRPVAQVPLAQNPQQSVPVPAPTVVRPLMPNRPHQLSPQMATPQHHTQHTQPSSSRTHHHAQPTSSSATSSSQQHSQSGDPFAPTPLHRIKERHQQKLEAHHRVGAHITSPSAVGTNSTHPSSSQPLPQQQPHMLPRSMPPQMSQQLVQQPPASSGGRSVLPQDRVAMEKEVRRQKEKFLMFTRVLIKYLEQKDPKMHQAAKMIIKDCAERNRRQEEGYQSVTAAMKERLKQLVGEQYWKRAEAYLKHFLEQKKAPGTGATSTIISSNRPSSSSSLQQKTLDAEAQRKAQLALQQRQQMQQQQIPQQPPQQQQQHQKPQQQQVVPPPTVPNLQQEIPNQKAKLSVSTSSGTAKQSSSAATTPSSGKGASVGKKSVKRKSLPSTPTSGTRKAPTPTSAEKTEKAPTSTPALAPKEVPDPNVLPPREYNKLMEMVDHAIDYDWTTAGQLLGSKTDLQLTKEQQNLLYSGESTSPQTPKPIPTTKGPLPGWGQRNVVSARAAWARIRLREQNAARSTPVVGSGLLTLPGSTSAQETFHSTWVNEEKAEEDVTLAMISEGCEIYLKGILEKAIHCARQRQNLDGIRLWHQQHSTSTNSEKPSLSLRLGCDVSRQKAQADGNAAMTSKRMEEALERQTGVPSQARVLKEETLQEATSMADLALRPQLSKGVESADFAAKRCYETFGGKDASEPPFGRVPKQAKLEVADFIMGSNISERIGWHCAGTASASLYF